MWEWTTVICPNKDHRVPHQEQVTHLPESPSQDSWPDWLQFQQGLAKRKRLTLGGPVTPPNRNDPEEDEASELHQAALARVTVAAAGQIPKELGGWAAS